MGPARIRPASFNVCLLWYKRYYSFVDTFRVVERPPRRHFLFGVLLITASQLQYLYSCSIATKCFLVRSCLFAHQTLALPISPYTIKRAAATNSSIGNFVSCSVPQIKFATGFDNRKESNFEPIDQREPLHPFVLTRSDIPDRSFLQPWIRSDH